MMSFILGTITGFVGTVYLFATGRLSQNKLQQAKQLFKKDTDNGDSQHPESTGN